MNKNTFLAYFLGISSVLLFTCTDSRAGCRMCSESYGVDIELKSGKKMSGYIAWYPEIAPLSFYIEKLNLLASTNTPLPYNVAIFKNLDFYKAFSKITYPAKMYVPTKEDTLEIPIQQVAQIKENTKFALKINTTHMKPVLARYIPELNKTPIYIVSNDFYAAWRQYFIAVSSSARPSYVIDYASNYIKSLVYLGELLGMYHFETSRFDCISDKKEDIEVCNAAKLEWMQLETDSREVKECYKKQEGVLELIRKTTDYSSAMMSPEYRKAEMDCFQIEDKFTTKYEPQLGNAAGFIEVVLSNEYTLLP